MSQQPWNDNEVGALKKLVEIASQITTIEKPEILDAQKINPSNAQEAKEALINFVQENKLVVAMSSRIIENEMNQNLEKQVSKVRMDVKQYILGADGKNSPISKRSQKKGRGDVGS